MHYYRRINKQNVTGDLVIQGAYSKLINDSSAEFLF